MDFPTAVPDSVSMVQYYDRPFRAGSWDNLLFMNQVAITRMGTVHWGFLDPLADQDTLIVSRYYADSRGMLSHYMGPEIFEVFEAHLEKVTSGCAAIIAISDTIPDSQTTATIRQCEDYPSKSAYVGTFNGWPDIRTTRRSVGELSTLSSDMDLVDSQSIVDREVSIQKMEDELAACLSPA